MPWQICSCRGNSRLDGSYALTITGMLYGTAGTVPVVESSTLEVSGCAVRFFGPQGEQQVGNIDRNGNFSIQYTAYGSVHTLTGTIRDDAVTGTYTRSGHAGSSTLSGRRK